MGGSQGVRVITIQNSVHDVVSSAMLEQLSSQIARQVDNVQNLQVDKSVLPHEKCELSTLLSFALGVGSGLTATMLWELMKMVYTHIRHPQGFKWKLTVKLDKSYTAIVHSEKGDVEIFIEEIKDAAIPKE